MKERKTTKDDSLISLIKELVKNQEEEEEIQRLFLECGCGPHVALEVEKLFDDMWNLSFWAPCFYMTQGSIFRIVWERIKLAWQILFKGEHLIHDFILYEEELKKIQQFFEEI